MPQLINGTGTWYHGKRNRFAVTDQCPQCGNLTRLVSYDTTKYFQLVYIPLVPLSKLRILNECAVCQKHQVAKLAEYEEQKAGAIAAATERLQEQPNDPASHIQAIETAAGFQDGRLFDALAGNLPESLSDDPDVLDALGAAHAFFSQHDRSVAAYERLLAQRDTPEVRHALAASQLRTDPIAAERTLEPVFEQSPDERFGWLFPLTDALLAHGHHDEAVRLFDEAAERDEELAADKGFKKAHKAAKKLARTKKRPKSAFTQTDASDGYQANESSGGLIKWIGPLVLAGLAALYFGSAWTIANSREVTLVNGLTKPYTVTIAGQSHDLQPSVPKTIRLPEGTHEIDVDPYATPPMVSLDGETVPLDEALGLDGQTVTIATPFISRPFADPLFVINPDRAALLLLSHLVYADRPADFVDELDPDTLHAGRLLHEFDDIEYAFVVAPERLESSGRRTFVEQVTLEDPADYGNVAAVFLLASNGVDQADAQAIADARTLADPTDRTLFDTATQFREPEKAAAILSRRLGDRPLRTMWHDRYLEKVGAAAAHERYATLAAAAPDDIPLALMAARSAPAGQPRIDAFRRVLERKPDEPAALYGVADERIAVGRFDEARQAYESAVAIVPDDDARWSPGEDLLLMAGETDALESLAADHLAREPRDTKRRLQTLHTLVRSDLARGDAERAGERVKAMMADGEGDFLLLLGVDAAADRILIAEGQADGYVAKKFAEVDGATDAERMDAVALATQLPIAIVSREDHPERIEILLDNLVAALDAADGEDAADLAVWSMRGYLLTHFGTRAGGEGFPQHRGRLYDAAVRKLDETGTAASAQAADLLRAATADRSVTAADVRAVPIRDFGNKCVLAMMIAIRQSGESEPDPDLIALVDKLILSPGTLAIMRDELFGE